jgi:hypothetical protein
MKVILSIGSSEWCCSSALIAAKVAELLGDCVPVQHIFEAGSRPDVYHEKRSYQHDVKIAEATKETIFTSSPAKVAELIRARKEDK